MSGKHDDKIIRDRDDDEVETATGQPNEPAIKSTGAPDPDGHGSAAADVVTDGEAGGSPDERTGAEPIANRPKGYGEGKDAAKDRK